MIILTKRKSPTVVCAWLGVCVMLPQVLLAQNKIQFADPDGSTTRSVPDVPVFDVPTPSIRDRKSDLVRNAQPDVEYAIEFDRVDPLQLMDEITQEMHTSLTHESSQLDGIREGLLRLKARNEELEKLKSASSRELAEVRRRAEQAERVAEDARRSVEQSQDVTLEAMRKLLEVQQRSQQSRPSSVAAPEKSQQPPASAEESVAGLDPTDAGPAQPSNPMIPVRPLPTTTPASPPIPLTDKTVDGEALADNLFGAAEYRTALSVYLGLLKDPVEGADTIWFDYQVACCYRNLGALDQAEKFYRRVAAEKDSHLSAIARWWLSTISDERKLEQQLGIWAKELSESQTDEPSNARQ